jgi:anti-anti-sigma regulatory factor
MSARTTYVLDGEATSAIVDLRPMESVGTRTMNALLAMRAKLVGRGGRIAVVLSPRQRRSFGLLGLDRRFVLAADRPQALERLGLLLDRPPVRRANARAA